MDKSSAKIIELSTPASIARYAKSIGVDPISALRMRYRYLKDRCLDMKSLYFEHDEVDPYFWWWVDAEKERLELVKYAKRFKTNPENGITEDMINIAASYPITELVEFFRGRAKAFCHEDSHPSAYYGNKTNKLFCPVCYKSFNPIDVLVYRDNMTFPAAVMFLQ